MNTVHSALLHSDYLEESGQAKSECLEESLYMHSVGFKNSFDILQFWFVA